MFELSGARPLVRWEKVLAEREGVGESVKQRPIYPKLTVLKKAVKSERDVAHWIFLDVLDE